MKNWYPGIHRRGTKDDDGSIHKKTCTTNSECQPLKVFGHRSTVPMLNMLDQCTQTNAFKIAATSRTMVLLCFVKWTVEMSIQALQCPKISRRSRICIVTQKAKVRLSSVIIGSLSCHLFGLRVLNSIFDELFGDNALCVTFTHVVIDLGACNS